MLWRMTSPSLRTYLLVETPTAAVCGAIGLPTSAPTELSDGSSSGGRFRRRPALICTGPNIAFVDVLLPDSATPTQPRIGARTMNARPTFEQPYAIEFAMPVKTKQKARPKMKNPTSSAPHIWWNVRENTSRSAPAPGRNSARITNHDARIAVPPLSGTKLKVDAVGCCVTELRAKTDSLKGT